MNNFGRNIRYLRKVNNMSQDDLAKKLNYKSFTTIQKWENGDSSPNLKIVHAIANMFKVDVDDLISVDLSLKHVPNIIDISEPIAKKIPILGTIACGEPIWAYENFDGYFVADTSIKADFIVKAKGDSMIEAGINDGDLVFLKKTPTVDNGRIGAVLIDDEATLKKVIKTDNAVILQPCNSDYQPIVLTSDDEAMILGEMVGVYQTRNK